MRQPVLSVLIVLATGCPSVDDDDDDVEPTPWPRPTSEASTTPLPDCDDPVSSPGAFVELRDVTGVDFVHTSDDAFLMDPDDFTMPFADSVAAGVVAADLDGDGTVDLFFPQTVGSNALYFGTTVAGAPVFTRVDPGEAGLSDAISATASAADFDGDGLLDLAVGTFQGLVLLRNDGERGFENVTDVLGVTPGGGWPGTPSWADYDGDGDLDLYEGRHVTEASEETGLLVTVPDTLWRNDGDRFTAVDDLFPTDDDGAWLHGVWRDFDDDGDPDLLHINDFGFMGPISFLWENTDSGFVDRIDDAGIGRLAAPMGVAVRDLDGDGREDLLFSDIGRLTSFAGFDDGFGFVDTSATWLADLEHAEREISWSVVDIDVDGDGHPSVFITYGPLPAEPGTPSWLPNQADRMLLPGDRFSEQDVFPAPPTGNSRGAAITDLNADGVPDLVVGRVREAPSLLAGRCTLQGRLVVDLHDPGTANRFALGARVTVEVEGIPAQVQEVVGGGRGTFSGSGPTLFYGLADAETAAVTVRWPDGHAEHWPAVPAGSRLRIERRTI